jgi:hypothetical protein
MKIFKLLLILWLPLTSSAQDISSAVAPDLLIIDFKLGPFMRIDVSSPPAAPRGETPPDPPDKIDPPRYETKLKPEIKVRNTGARIIKRIDCEFLLSTRGGPTTDLKSFKVSFSKVLRPGDTVRFSKLMQADHLGIWRQRQKEGSMSVRASISRIEYSDGSVWDRGPLRVEFRD